MQNNDRIVVKMSQAHKFRRFEKFDIVQAANIS